MTKHFSLNTMTKLDKMFDVFQTVVSRKIVQLCTLTINKYTDKRFRWATHPIPQQIISSHYWTTRLALQAHFKNHVININELIYRPYNLKYFRDRDLQDVFKAYFRIPQHSTSTRKVATVPEFEKRNIFIYCEDPYEEYFYNVHFFKLPNINKIVCFPKEKTLKVDKQLEQFAIQNSVRLLPMAELTVESMLKYIWKNKKGNILVNQIVDGTGKYILQPTDKKYQPEQILLLCDQTESCKGFKAGQGSFFLDFKDLAQRYVPHDRVDIKEQDFSLLNFVQHLKHDQQIVEQRESDFSSSEQQVE